MENIKRLLNRKSFRAKAGEKSMKAVVYSRKEPSGVRLAEDIKVPALETTQVLVRVHCCALNHLDYRKQEAMGGLFTSEDEPVGVEFVGTIERLGWKGGDHVHMFPLAIGDVVFGMSKGAVAEYVVAEASKVSFKLDDMDDEQAAAFPVAGLTALQALKNNGFGEGNTIMIIGAQDAIGVMFAKQAKLLGASKVIGCAEEEHQEFVSSFCSDVAANESASELAAECDLIVDLVSDPAQKRKEGDPPTFFEQCKPSMKKDAKYAQINANPVDMARKLISDQIGFNVQRPGFDAPAVKPRSEELKQLAEWFQKGSLAQAIDSIVPFEQAAIQDAYAKLKANKAQGKLVVRVAHPRR